MRNFTLILTALLASFGMAQAQDAPETLVVSVPGSQIVASDDPVELEFAVTGGEAPYTFKLTSIDLAVNETIESENMNVIVPLSFAASTSVLVEVESHDGLLGHSSFDVVRTDNGAGLTADFENIATDGQYWNGFAAADGGATYCYIYSGGIGFQNQYTPMWSYWSGTAVSGDLSTEFDPKNALEGQYRNVTGRAYDGEQFAVHYWSSWEPLNFKVVGEDGNGMELQGVAITNTFYTVNSIINGDAMAKPFAEGDYMKLIFTGDNDSGTPAEIYLADYRDGNTYVLNDWEWLDLSSLGKVTTINVALECTNEMTPTYFAFDTMTEKGSGINAVKVGQDSKVAIRAIGNGLQVNGLNETATLRVFSLDGRQVLAAEVSGSHNGVSTATLPAGSYIATVAGASAKFMKR